MMTASSQLSLLVVLLLLQRNADAFLGFAFRSVTAPPATANPLHLPPLLSTTTGSQISSSGTNEKYTTVPGSFRPSIVDKARTITHICTSGTLCTTSVMDDVEGSPFGSYVDYVLDNNGWPVMLLSAQSLHTININKNPLVSLFCQLPRAEKTQTTAALSRVTVMGTVVPLEPEQINPLKLAFTLSHPYAEQIVDSPKFTFYKIEPRKIYFSGGFGVMATWVDVPEYESARPDVLASEVSSMLSKVRRLGLG